jgi:predicted 3-demethylubiquinone-9 3-methyltransferase (glyoxalase superfamily)
MKYPDPMKRKLYPCLWFENQAADAARFYCDVFGDGTITSENPMVTTFEISGFTFMALNGGPMFKPNPSVSFYVVFDTEAEVGRAWDMLREGGVELMPLGDRPWSKKYGWLSDRYGISWQLTIGDGSAVSQRITTTLMFTQEVAGRAKEAMDFYTGLFTDSEVQGILQYGPGGEDVADYIKHAQFVLNGQLFMAMDSSHAHAFTFGEGVSMVVDCDTQEEIDFFWNRLTDGGMESMCCWLKDRFGLWWQVVPSRLGEWLSDPVKGEAVGKALMQMKKPVISDLLG